MLITMQQSCCCVFFNTHNLDGTESEHPLVFTFIYREFKAFLPEKRMLGMRYNLGNKTTGSRSDTVQLLSGDYGSEMSETFVMGHKDISRDLKSYTGRTKFDATISFERKINHCIIVSQIYVNIHTVVQLVMIPIFAQSTLRNVRYGHLFAYTSLGHSWNNRKIQQVKVADGKDTKIMNDDIIDHKTCCTDGGSMAVEKADSSCTESLEETKGSKSIVNDFNEKIHRKRKRRYKKRHALQKADLGCIGEDQARPKEIKSVRNDVESHPVYCTKSEKIHRRRRMYTKNCTWQKADSSCTEECLSEPKGSTSLGNDAEPHSMYCKKRMCIQLHAKTVGVVIIFFFIWMLFGSGQAIPINPNLSPIWSAPLLTTPLCNNNTLNYSDTCQTDKYMLNLLLQRCTFKCYMGYTAKCVNTLDGGSSYICLPEHLSCQKGVRLTAQINTEKPSEVIIREEKCPNGTFQSNESHCFDVCSEKHRDIGLLGETYRLHSYGDNVNPTIVYCNYEKGFYSTKNKTWIDFDRESKFNPFLCRHVDDFNPCSGKMAPLPNGTCVSPCLKGQCRDAHDNFICKEICRQEQGEDSDATGDRSQDKDICNNILDACKNGKCNSKGDCECYEGFTYDEKMQQCKEDKRKEKQSYTGIVIGSISGVFVGVGVCVAVFVYCICRRRENIRCNEGSPESISLTSTKSADLNQEGHQRLSLTSTSSAEYEEVPREKKQGNIKKKTIIVNGDFINIYASKNVQINKKNVPDDESKDSSRTTIPEINENDSDDLNDNEHDLENLKEHLNNQDDIGLFTSEETRVKELLQASE